ncbi:MAG: CBU_0592 family membrane protein [Acidimicrobiia bacterium]
MGQVVQIVGALLIVGAYLAYTRGRLRLDSVQFLGMNMVGAAVLTVIAFIDDLYGFLLLEAVWTWVSARGFRRALKARHAAKSETKSSRSTRSAARARGRKGPNPLRRVD